MLRFLQMQFREDPKNYELLKENSYYFKYLNRGSVNYKSFVNNMKEKYKLRASDKLESVLDNIDLVNSVLDVLK